ncbi:hypothetical protein D3C86_1910200 [compost metagenome]
MGQRFCVGQILVFCQQRGGQLPLQAVQCGGQLSTIFHFHQNGCRAKHFLLQQRVSAEQQIEIGLIELCRC